MTTASRESFVIGTWLYVRGIALVYLVAFASLAQEIEALAGSKGLMPAGAVLDWVQRRGQGWWDFPTLAWIDHSDGMLWGTCMAGMVFSGLLFFRVVPVVSAFLCYILFLSTCTIGVDFLGFQWDSLLCEAGLVAVLLATARPLGRLRSDPAPVRAAVWLSWWLVFRLMFSSGVVKLTSGDPTWRDLSALSYHYETQPIPTWTAWYMHNLPEGFHALCTLGVHVIEVAIPAALLAACVASVIRPTKAIIRTRHACATVTILLMLVLVMTGNYAYFNWLTIAACMGLYSDRLFLRIRPLAKQVEGPRRSPHRAVKVTVTVVAATLSLMGALTLGTTLLGRKHTPPWAWKVQSTWSSTRAVNSYGLFRVMTTKRPEIVFEGSADGVTWKAYELPYKPGDLARAPVFVAPHQPRLDWQLWFAALRGRCSRAPWFNMLQRRLLEGEPAVLALFARNPFPDTPPRFVRTTLYNYNFTTSQERDRHGHWWKRQYLGPFCPQVSLGR